MNDFNNSGELYTIRNQFYTGQHQKVAAYDVQLFSQVVRPKVLELQIRSHVALAHDASQLIDGGRTQFADHATLFDLLQAWNDLHALNTGDSTYFEAVNQAEFEAQACLTALYWTKVHGNHEQAISILAGFVSSTAASAHDLEPYLLLVQLHLIHGRFAEASKVFAQLQKFPVSARDDIVYQVAESWISAAKGGFDNINNASCFYDELLAADFDGEAHGKYHLLGVLFALNVQLKRYPEAQDLLEQIDQLQFKNDTAGDLLANRMTFEYLTKKGENVVGLLRQLAGVNPNHALLADLKDKNAIFDAIVEKYQPANAN